jgi:hypothetical protein
VEYPWESRLAGQVKRVRLKEVSQSGRMKIELIE